VLADAGIEMSVNIAPVIPGINDAQIPAILERAKEAGATSVALMPVRLAAEVMPVFMERMEKAFPGRFSAMKSAIQQVRNGNMNESAFGKRMTGEGPRWDAIRSLFDVHVRRLGLEGWRGVKPEGDEPEPETTFRRPSRQGVLFQ